MCYLIKDLFDLLICSFPWKLSQQQLCRQPLGGEVGSMGTVMAVKHSIQVHILLAGDRLSIVNTSQILNSKQINMYIIMYWKSDIFAALFFAFFNFFIIIIIV